MDAGYWALLAVFPLNYRVFPKCGKTKGVNLDLFNKIKVVSGSEDFIENDKQTGKHVLISKMSLKYCLFYIFWTESRIGLIEVSFDAYLSLERDTN